jgi:hypothetical protein
VNLLIGHINDVNWDREAFKSLAIDEKTKTLIKALVTTKITAGKSTDLISGKGNGLILLLHGYINIPIRCLRAINTLLVDRVLERL